MCDCGIAVRESFFKKTCLISVKNAWVDSSGACTEKRRSAKCAKTGCIFFDGNDKIGLTELNNKGEVLI